jgi:hypothetical protein
MHGLSNQFMSHNDEYWHLIKRKSESDALFTDNKNGHTICVRGGRKAG